MGHCLFYALTAKRRKRSDMEAMNASHLEVRESWLNELLQRNHESSSQSITTCKMMGLFATSMIEKDIEICRYYGKVYQTKEALVLKDKSYLMRLGEQCYVDPKDCESCLARYINDCRNIAGYNVRFEKHPDKQYAAVISTRRIYEEEELFVNYGKTYWAGSSVKPVRLSFSDLCRLRPRMIGGGDDDDG